MDWQCVYEKDGVIIHEKEGIMPDPDMLLKMNEVSQHPGEKARVSATVQRSIAYGEVKCSFTLSVSCPQSKEWVDKAAEQLFALAVGYVNAGMSWLAPGLEPLPAPTPK